MHGSWSVGGAHGNAARHQRKFATVVGIDGLGLQALELEVFEVGLVVLVKIWQGPNF